MQNLAWHTAFNAFIIVGLLLILGCKKEGASCTTSRGAQAEEVRLLPSFDSIHVNGLIKLTLVADTTDYCVVHYGENLLFGIKTDIQNGVLFISEQNKCDWIRKSSPTPQVEIHYTQLRHLASSSATTVKFENTFIGDSLWIEVEDASGSLHVDAEINYLQLLVHTGATDITLKGSSKELYIYNSGYGPVRADSFQTNIATVHNNSLGDTYVNASEILYYQIYHRGNIYLLGNATATKWHSSGGGMLFLL